MKKNKQKKGQHSLSIQLNILVVFNQILILPNSLFRCIRVRGVTAVTHLTFGSDAYVSVDRCLRPQVDGLLNADISQGIFSKDRTSIKVGSHEAAEAGQSLVCKNKRD